MKLENNQKQLKGFSLVELSITILIIGVLVGAIIGSKKIIEKTKILSGKWQSQNNSNINAPDVVFSSKTRLWLDAKNINGSYNAGLRDGQKIKEWKDLSGNYLPSTTVSSYYPTYEGDLVNFAQYQRLFVEEEIQIGNYWEVFVIYDFDTQNQHTSWNTIFRGKIQDHHLLINPSNNLFGLYDNSSGGFSASSLNVLNYSSKNLINMIANLNKSTITINNIDSSVINKIISEPIYTVGNHNGGQGFGGISEIILFNSILDDQERVEINYYLSRKWGLTAKIDSDGDGVVDANDPTPSGSN